MIAFRRRARVEANDPNLQIKRLMVGAGSEWHAACETWTTAENIEVVRTQGSKSASNSIAEVHVRIARRMFVHDFNPKRSELLLFRNRLYATRGRT